MTEKLRATLKKVEALAADPSAPAGERASAKNKAEELRAKIKLNGGAAVSKIGDARWKQLVAKGKKLHIDVNNHLWELGELATQVDTDYAGDALGKYAEEIGENYNTLKHCRTTWRTWIGNEKGRQRPNSIFTAQELNAHPKKFEIAHKYPNLTQKKARELMQAHNANTTGETRKTAQRSKKATEKKDKDWGGVEIDIRAILGEFLVKDGNVHSLIRTFPYGDAVGPGAKKRILKELHDLRSRVDKEISWLESINQLN